MDAEDAKNLANVQVESSGGDCGGRSNVHLRYEHDTAKPLAAVINLFRLLETRPELLEEFEGAR